MIRDLCCNDQRKRLANIRDEQRHNVPSPLVGEGQGDGWFRMTRSLSPHPRPLPTTPLRFAGGGERIGRASLTVAILSLSALVCLLPSRSRAQDIYRGKTITIICGYGVGGGYDAYARLLARHLGNHIPGQPTVIVQNMPGAGGLRAANMVAVTAPKDGTTIAAVNPSLLMYQLLGGPQARYQTGTIKWLGSLDEPNNSIITWHTSAIRTIEDAKTRDVPMPGDGPTSSMSIYPTVTNALLGTRFKIVEGYSGSAAGDLAMERGEVDGRSGANLTSIFARRADWVRERKINFLLQIGNRRDPLLPDVPLLQDLLTSERDRQIATVASLPTTVGPGYWMAPEVPDAMLAIVRRAFEAAIKDPALLADAKALSLEVRPKTGVEMQAAVEKVAQFPADVLTQTAAILKW
jgi:tripartite-type tricarboxylate transporter receptor subunit TctC